MSDTRPESTEHLSNISLSEARGNQISAMIIRDISSSSVNHIVIHHSDWIFLFQFSSLAFLLFLPFILFTFALNSSLSSLHTFHSLILTSPSLSSPFNWISPFPLLTSFFVFYALETWTGRSVIISLPFFLYFQLPFLNLPVSFFSTHPTGTRKKKLLTNITHFQVVKQCTEATHIVPRYPHQHVNYVQF